MLKSREVVNALLKAGFKPKRQRGSDVRLKHLDGRVVTVPQHGLDDIGRGLLHKILRDAEIGKDDFLKLLD